MQLGFGLSFHDLYAREGLEAVDRAFLTHLTALDSSLHARLESARANAPEDKALSDLLLDLAPHVDDFMGELFGISRDVRQLAERHHEWAPVYACKRLFVQRRAAKLMDAEQAARLDPEALLSMLPLVSPDDPYFELVFAKVVMGWLEDEPRFRPLLELAGRYAAWALLTEAGRKRHGEGLLFRQPKKCDPARPLLLPAEVHPRPRDGFNLTDDGGVRPVALDQAHYCIVCHPQGKDSCRKGFQDPGGGFKKNALGVEMHGCPLEEKISEMNQLKSKGISIGALAVIVIDNPMCAGTGHRICNDCMKSCIYQKQEPVNVPLIETHVLRDVLHLPYGFEIYSLLTRWNPLNVTRPLPKQDSGKRVLVAGLGPAGYTLAHHLLQDGHTVVAVDGLKIEPLPAHLSGVSPAGGPVAFEPIRDIATLSSPLSERPAGGFGGVAEYGITVRWDKNNLTILRLLLERRAQAFSMIGGVRFGGTLTYDRAFALGFDHIALCLGAGAPTLIEMENGLARGVRMASDFLMALQLTGAARDDSIANLQVRLPIVVIGGGLTAIDTATEALAYYPIQVEKFLTRYEALVRARGEKAVRTGWSGEETKIAEEFLTHASALRDERRQAKREGRATNLIGLLQSWGGARLVYRKSFYDAPSYRLNHEEVEKALEEGIQIDERLEPVGVDIDTYGHAQALRCVRAGSETRESVRIPARTILIAAGTQPNTVLSREDSVHFTRDGRYFQAVDMAGEPIRPAPTPKPDEAQVLLSINEEGRSVSFFGDLHPSFSGSVVKAMASAKRGYPVVTEALKKSQQSAVSSRQFLDTINDRLRAAVHEVKRLTPTIVEVVVHAPLAAEAFQPGQFYRLHNYEARALKLNAGTAGPATMLAMEGLAMTGAWVDKDRGLVGVIALEMGGSSDLCAYLKPGEPVVLMGPTGAPTEIPENETVLLIGGGLGNAVLFSIGKAMRARGCRVLYFAGYRKAEDCYKTEEIEAAADVVVWCCDQTPLPTGRPQDVSFHGNMVDALVAYARHPERRETPAQDGYIPLSSIQRLIVIGSDGLMAAVAGARHSVLKPYLNPAHVAIGSINSPMQCMMKEICAQCLQKHRDPETGRTYYVYSCYNQDQALDRVDFPHLRARLMQNSLSEKLAARWVDHSLQQLGWRSETA